MLARISEAFVAVDREWRITYANEQIAELSEFGAGDLIGQDLWEVFPGLAESKFGRVYRGVANGERPGNSSRRLITSPWTGDEFHANAYPSPDGRCG